MPSKLLDYDILSEIGSGSYGTCKKVRRRSDQKVGFLCKFDHEENKYLHETLHERLPRSFSSLFVLL